MAFESLMHLFSRDSINQASGEQPSILSNTSAPTLMEPNKRRILRNEVAAKVAAINKSA